MATGWRREAFARVRAAAPFLDAGIEPIPLRACRCFGQPAERDQAKKRQIKAMHLPNSMDEATPMRVACGDDDLQARGHDEDQQVGLDAPTASRHKES